MIPVKMDQIQPEHLRQLIDSARAENQTLDYKAELPAPSARGTQDFLKDVAAFANSEGGDLVYTEKLDSAGRPTGYPDTLAGTSTENAQQELLRLQQTAHDGLDPAPRIEIQIVRGDFPRGPVFVVRVAPSPSGPLMVKSNRTFYVRRSTQSVPLQTADQIRALFVPSGKKLSPHPPHWMPPAGEAWLRTALLPKTTGAEIDLFGSLTRSLLEAVSGVQLPLYLSAPLTARPNPTFTRPTTSSLLHEDFRKLESDGVGFRIEIHERGTVDFATCLDELLGRFSVKDLMREANTKLWPGSAPVQRCRAVLPYDDLTKIFVSQLTALAHLWQALPLQDGGGTLYTQLTKIKGVCLYSSDAWSSLLGHPPADEDISFYISTDSIEPRFEEAAMQQLVRGFGLRLDGLYDARGAIRRPTLFAQ